MNKQLLYMMRSVRKVNNHPPKDWISRALPVLLVGVLSVGLITANAQSTEDSFSLVLPKLIIINGQDQLLLVYDSARKAYEVPGSILQGRVSFKTYVDKLCDEINIHCDSFYLGGIFTYIFPNRYRTFIRPYFIVHASFPHKEFVNEGKYKWILWQDAINEIPYPASAMIVSKLLFSPGPLWGATFEEFGYTNPVDKTKIRFRIIEEFYELHSVKK